MRNGSVAYAPTLGEGKPPRPPTGLSDKEVTGLVQAFTAGKTEVLETDVVTLVTWAQHQRLGNLLVGLILDGQVVPSVEDGQVKEWAA